MIKNVLYIFALLFLFSCDTENGSDCFKTSGSVITKNYVLDDFTKIIVHENIKLEIKQGTENHIQISYGNNIIDNITTDIIENKLSIANTTSCSFTRNFEPAKVILTVIDITEIRNASQFVVFSNEIMRFDSLTLISEDHLIDYVNVGDFDLYIKNKNLNIITNNVSNFYIKGKTDNLDIVFAAGTGKFEGEQLIAQNIHLFHRGINNIVINPIQQLTGEIRGVGNVIAVKRPPLVDVQEFYTGKLIFRD
ncbi:MAG: DUF2807 domain-containing protein [Flavobacteriaceae bacterium]|nr:DUF2807 domain-containing protein [Flavobacteriaceae bacterium]